MVWSLLQSIPMRRHYITLRLQKIHIGKDATRGLGAGTDPSVGEHAAQESIDEIQKNNSWC